MPGPEPAQTPAGAPAGARAVPVPPTVHLFVYGTLKQGFPNHPLNPGLRLPGLFRTCRAHPLYVVRLPHEARAPWLMDCPGQGLQVIGEVYEVNQDALSAMDRFEEVGLPTGYHRAPLAVAPWPDQGPVFEAQAYLKPRAQLPQCLAIEGPFEAYTLDLAQGYDLRAAPPPGDPAGA